MNAQMVPENMLEPTKGWRVMKNVGVLGLSFMFYFIAYNGAVDLQNYVTAEASLGTTTLASEYAGNLLSNIFLSTVFIKWFGTRRTMLWSLVAQVPYIASQMYPSSYTLVPAAFLLGLGCGPLWCAKCTYLSVTADVYSSRSKLSAEVLLQRFFGFFYMFYEIGEFGANFISSSVLLTKNKTSVTSINKTINSQVCGANFKEDMDDHESLSSQPPEKIQLLTGIYLGFMFASILVCIVGVDSLDRYEPHRQNSQVKVAGIALVVATLKLLAEPNQMLLLAIYVFMGLQQSFIVDFTTAFVSCAGDTGSVGYVMMAFGLSDAAACYFNGYLAKVIGSLSLIICTLFIHITILVTLLLWTPHSADYYIMFFIAILWGFCDSVWQIQIIACCGLVFPGKEEAAFSNFGLFEEIGIIITYNLSSNVRTYYKIDLLLCSLIVGILGYFIVKYRYRKAEHNVEIVSKDTYRMSDNNF